MAKIVSVDIHHNATINKESMKVVSKCSPLVFQETHKNRPRSSATAEALHEHTMSVEI